MPSIVLEGKDWDLLTAKISTPHLFLLICGIWWAFSSSFSNDSKIAIMAAILAILGNFIYMWQFQRAKPSPIFGLLGLLVWVANILMVLYFGIYHVYEYFSLTQVILSLVFVILGYRSQKFQMFATDLMDKELEIKDMKNKP